MITRYQRERADIATTISGSSSTIADRSFTAFTLLPSVDQAPTIGGQPIDNITQTTWADRLNGELIYQDKTDLFFNNVVNIVEGTAFAVSTIANNPAKRNTQEGLSYVWKRNGLVLQGSRFENTSTLVFESRQSTKDKSGIYVCEVTNEFGTTTTDPVTLNIINPATEVIFTKNILEDGSGDANLEEWSQDGDKIKPLEFLDFYTTRGFASVTKNGFFRFSNDQRANEAQSKLIGNDNPSQPYAAFFPSPKLIDDNTPYNLIENISPYYIGLAPFEYGNRNQYAISQFIPLGDYFDYVDGAAYGINGCNYELFHYLGAGITKYTLSFNGGLEVTSSYQPTTEIYPDSEEYPEDVFDIDLVPAGYDEVDGFIQFADSSGNILSRDLFNNPSLTDLAAVIKPQITSADAQELFQLVPNRKVDFTKLIKKLFNFPGGDEKPSFNAFNRYWNLPFFRVRDSRDNSTADPLKAGLDKDVFDIDCVPANNYTYNVTLRVENRTKPIIIRHKSDGELVTQYKVLQDGEPLLPLSDFSDLDRYIRHTRLRLLLMELTLDTVTYGVDITKNTPAEYNTDQTLGTLLCLYFTMITTAAEYRSPADDAIWDFGRITNISNELLGYAVSEQEGSTYLDVFNKILVKYIEARVPSGDVIDSSGQGSNRLQLKFTQNYDDVVDDWAYVVGYLSNDFRFRKLCTILYALMFVSPNELPRIFSWFGSGVSENTRIRRRAQDFFSAIFPRLPLADQQRLKADYFKLIEQDTARDDKQQLPLVMQPQTQRLGLFVNASPRIYGSYTPGGAAFFAYNLTGSIPPGARGASVQYRFTTDINTAIDQPEDWPSSKITLDGYSVYGSPRMGVASSTLLVRPILTATNVASSYIPIPQNNVWYNAIRNNTRLQTIPSADILNICRSSVRSYFRVFDRQTTVIANIPIQQSPYNVFLNVAINSSAERNEPSSQFDGPNIDFNMQQPTGSYISNGFQVKEDVSIFQPALQIINSNITTKAILTRYQELSLLRF